MAQFAQHGIPHEIELGGIRIAGSNPTPVMAQIQKFIDAAAPKSPVAPVQVQALLDRSALELTQGTPRGTPTLVLDLESVELVRISANHPGQVRWFCSTDPRDLVGPLFDHYRGAYYRAKSRELVYSNDTDLEVYTLNSNTALTPTLLSAVCIAREAGVTEAAIRKVLETGKSQPSVRDRDFERHVSLQTQ